MREAKIQAKAKRVLILASGVAGALSWLGMSAVVIGVGGFVGGLVIHYLIWGGSLVSLDLDKGKSRGGKSSGSRGPGGRQWVSKDEWEADMSQRLGRPVTWEEYTDNGRTAEQVD